MGRGTNQWRQVTFSFCFFKVTSPDLLYQDWSQNGGGSRAAQLLAEVPSDAALVTVLDGHPLALSWLGACHGHRHPLLSPQRSMFPARSPLKPGCGRVQGLGVERFGQSGDLVDLYREYGLDIEAEHLS